jgi:hypothetical protein
MQNAPSWLLPVCLFPLVWVGVIGLISRLGGWGSLAKTYGVPALPEGKRFRFQSLIIQGGWLPGNYRSCVTLVVGEEGLGIGVLWPFRFRHPPLLIPWSDFRRAEQKDFFGLARYVVAEVGDPTVAKLYLPNWTFAQANRVMAAGDEPQAAAKER